MFQSRLLFATSFFMSESFVICWIFPSLLRLTSSHKKLILKILLPFMPFFFLSPTHCLLEKKLATSQPPMFTHFPFHPSTSSLKTDEEKKKSLWSEMEREQDSSWCRRLFVEAQNTSSAINNVAWYRDSRKKSGRRRSLEENNSDFHYLYDAGVHAIFICEDAKENRE